MSKVRVYELAKQYGMKGPEMADTLRKLGFENVKSHMAVLDEADQMMVMARLEAQGLQASTLDTQTEAKTAGKTLLKKKTLTKKTLPKKKGLPPAAARDTLRKKLPGAGAHTPSGATTTPMPDPLADVPEVTTATQSSEAEISQAAEVADAPATVAESPTESIEAPPAETAPAEASVAAAPAAEQTSQEAEPQIADEPADKPTDKPEYAEAPVQEATAEAAPAAELSAAAGGAEVAKPDAAEKKPVRKLIAPQAKAQVLRRIQLPQETIRDATRRSAPGGARNPGGVDGSLRRAAFQHTQSRSGTRAPGGPARRGPGGRGGPRGPGRGRDNRGRQGRQKGGLGLAIPIDPTKVVEIQPPLSVKGLSEALGVKVNQLIAALTFKLDIPGKTINSFLTPDEVELIALELDRNIKIVEHKEAEEELIQSLVEQATDETQTLRAPVVTFMGHVDHGKTTLLDALRKTDVITSELTKGEAGGITQHIGAYKVTTKNGQSFVILDTPGHAAFTAMRARGAGITDIVVLVVAADDGVMPQTEEALAHAKQADSKIVVAVNKCDVHGANPMQVRQQLAIKGVQTEDYGGGTQVADVSALTGQGLDELVEKIMLEAEVLELQAKPSAPASGVVIESRQSAEQGIVVNVLVTDGTLRLKDQLICGESYSRVRGMTDDHGRQTKEAGPSTPITVLGLSKLPMPGDKFHVVADGKKAREVIEDRQRRARDISLAERSTVTLENISAAMADLDVREVKVILKADVMGSLEPIKNGFADIANEEVRTNIIHSGLGSITETDVSLAEASDAIIIGFNTVADGPARIAADRAGVEIRFYSVIYALMDDMKLALEGLLKPDEIESVQGHAEVRAVFRSSKVGNIAGCFVLDGTIARNQKARLSRDGRVVYTGSISSLRRINDDVREVKGGYECGLTLSNYNDIKEGDQIEVYTVELVKRKLT